MPPLLEESHCTEICRSKKHGNLIISAISRKEISDIEVYSYMKHICLFCETAKSDCDANVLQLTALCGRFELLNWLILNKNIIVQMKSFHIGGLLRDTMLHGQLNMTVELIKLGANIDNIYYNKPICGSTAVLSGCCEENNFGELYTWGTNNNNSLGPYGSRTSPDLDVFHKENGDCHVKQICIDKFHSVIVTQKGEVFSCGHGLGGRLGQTVETAFVVPKQVFINTTSVCYKASIARDHSLFLMDDGTVYACGLNTYMVLGVVPVVPKILAPKQIRSLPKNIVGIVASRYHSVAWSETDLYTWGLNAGQLGHDLPAAKHVISPKSVHLAAITSTNTIMNVASSEGAIAVALTTNEIFVIYQYRCKRISPKRDPPYTVKALCMIGGTLDDTYEKDLSKQNFHELIVAILTTTGSILIWQESFTHLRDCIPTIIGENIIRHIALSEKDMLLISMDGTAYKGKLEFVDGFPSDSVQKTTIMNQHHVCHVKVTKIPRIYRAIYATSDLKGENYGIIQELPYRTEMTSAITSSEMLKDFTFLIEETNEMDFLHDITIKIDNNVICAHKFILSQKSAYFKKLFSDKTKEIVVLKDVNIDIFKQFLTFIYTGKCELIDEAECPEKLKVLCEIRNENQKENKLNKENIEKKSTQNPIKMLEDLASRFECKELQLLLAKFEMRNYIIINTSCCPKPAYLLEFDRLNCPHLFDITIKCEDDGEIPAHKCILAARMEYFKNMFSLRWQSDNLKEVSLPSIKPAVQLLVDYLYTDQLPSVEVKEIDLVMKLLVLVDIYFIDRLKVHCEHLLARSVNLKNAIRLLIFSYTYNAPKLTYSAMFFICYNIPHFLESRILETLPDDILNDLSNFYNNIYETRDYSSTHNWQVYGVPDEEIRRIAQEHPVDLQSCNEKITPKSLHKRRSRIQRNSNNQTSINDSVSSPETLIQFPDSPEVYDLPLNGDKSKWLLAAAKANKTVKNETIVSQFTRLGSSCTSDLSTSSFDTSLEAFPELSSPPKVASSHNKTQKSESRTKINKMSQKERKRLFSETKENDPIPESPKNPWKTIPDVTKDSNVNLEKITKISDIILDEKKQKENLVKLKNKPLVVTQIEDKAIDDLEKFYNISNIEDEIITVERVTIGNIASPFWVPKTSARS